MNQPFEIPTKPELLVKAPILPDDERVLTPGALQFLTALHRKFGMRRLELLEARVKKQQALDEGKLPDFLPETLHVRDESWSISPLPATLLDRRVEITGPVDRKMI